jgi:hypothetical protein
LLTPRFKPCFDADKIVEMPVRVRGAPTHNINFPNSSVRTPCRVM